MNQKRSEYVLAIIFCLVGICIFVISNTIPTMVAVEKSSVVNSRFFPRLMSGLLIVFSIIMAIENYFRTVTSRNSSSENERPQEKRPGSLKNEVFLVGAIGGLCLGYFFLLNIIGFLLSSILFMVVFLVLLRNRRWFVVFPVSIGIPLAIYLIFEKLLGVLLPEGMIFELF